MIDPAFEPYLAQPQQTQPQRLQSYAPADLGVDPVFAPYLAQPNFTNQLVKSDEVPVDEQSDESIMQQMAGTTLSGLAAFGNLFDLPGSTLRDIGANLAGRSVNPFDQWMTPFSADNRTTGRELLTDLKITRANDPTRWEWADVGGFGLEVAMDPFTWVAPTAVAKGAGKTVGQFIPESVKTAAKNSAVGKATRAVGRKFNQHFVSKVLGTKSEKGQAAARKLYDAELSGTQKAYFDLNPIIQSFAESKDPAALGDKIRRYAELRFTEGFNDTLDEVEQSIFDGIMNLMDGDFGKLSALGAKTKEMQDVIGHFPRSLSDAAKESWKGIRTGETRPPSLFSVFAPNWIGRQEWLKGWKRGTQHVDEVFTDPEWRRMLDEIAKDGKGRDTAIDAISEKIAEKYGDDIERFYTKAELDENGFPVTVDGEEVVKEVDRYREIAKRIIDVPEWEKFGVFQNNALMDAANAHIANTVKANTIDATYDILSTPGNITDKFAPVFRKAGEADVTVGDMLKDMDVDLDIGVQHIMERMGEDAGTQAARNRFRNRIVDSELADDLRSAWKYWDTPDEIKDLGKGWRSITSLFKAGVLTHPARYTRDVMSAMVRNAERGMWSPKDMYTAGRVLFGQEVTGLSEIPAVRAWLEESGREVTDKNASLAVREMLGNMRASSVYQNTDTAFSGQAGKNVPKTQYHRQRVYKQMVEVFGQEEADSLIQVTDARAAWAQKNAGINADSYYRDRIGDIRAWETAKQFEQSLTGGEDVLRQGGSRIGGQGLDIAFDATDGAPPYINVTKDGDYVGEIAMNTQTPLQERFIREKFNIPDSEKVSRIYGINVDDKFRGQGLGKRLYLEMADQVDGWIWNNQSSDDAIRTLDSLKRDGLLEVRWEDAGNRVRNQHRIMRITEKGRRELNKARDGGSDVLYQAGVRLPSEDAGVKFHEIQESGLRNPEDGGYLQPRQVQDDVYTPGYHEAVDRAETAYYDAEAAFNEDFFDDLDGPVIDANIQDDFDVNDLYDQIPSPSVIDTPLERSASQTVRFDVPGYPETFEINFVKNSSSDYSSFFVGPNSPISDLVDNNPEVFADSIAHFYKSNPGATVTLHSTPDIASKFSSALKENFGHRFHVENLRRAIRVTDTQNPILTGRLRRKATEAMAEGDLPFAPVDDLPEDEVFKVFENTRSYDDFVSRLPDGTKRDLARNVLDSETNSFYSDLAEAVSMSEEAIRRASSSGARQLAQQADRFSPGRNFTLRYDRLDEATSALALDTTGRTSGSGEKTLKLLRAIDEPTSAPGLYRSGNYMRTLPEGMDALDRQSKIMQDMGLLGKRDVLYQGKKGAVQFDQANKATIHWFKNNADVSTAAHELGHIFRRDLADYAPELHERAAKALGVKDKGNWTRAEEEAFAEQWESYLKNGQAPNKALTGVFQQFKEWLSNIYRSLSGQPQAVNPELKRVFDDMLSESPNARQAFGDYKSIDSLLETTVAGQRPGTASTLGQSLQELGTDFIGASPETNLNPMNVAGNAIGNAGDVRRKSQFGPVVVGDRVGRFTDDLSRLTPLLYQLRKMSPSQIDEAGGIFNAVKREIDDIQKMQISYSPRDFTRTEQALKQVFPFYSFMRGNLAYVASEMVGNRAKQGMFAPGAGLRNNVRAGRLMTGEDDGYAPQYVSETTSVNMGELPDGSRRYLTGLGLMHEDPFSLLTFNKNSSLPDLGDAGIELMSRMNPMIKAPIEYATGESFFQRGPMGGRDLGDMDPLVGRLASNVSEMLGGDPLVDASGRQALPMGGVMPVGGGLMEHIIANSPVSRILSTARQITDQRKWQPLELPGGVDVPFGGLAANTLTGARFTDVSLPAQQAVMNDKINAYGRENLDARVYQNVYVPKEVIAEYEKTDPAKARKAKVINRAKQIFKKKREEVEAGSQ